jgi:hypothetical protein
MTTLLSAASFYLEVGLLVGVALPLLLRRMVARFCRKRFDPRIFIEEHTVAHSEHLPGGGHPLQRAESFMQFAQDFADSEHQLFGDSHPCGSTCRRVPQYFQGIKFQLVDAVGLLNEH